VYTSYQCQCYFISVAGWKISTMLAGNQWELMWRSLDSWEEEGREKRTVREAHWRIYEPVWGSLNRQDVNTDNSQWRQLVAPSTAELTDWLSSVLCPHQHSIGYLGEGFYRSKDPTNSIKVLKEKAKKENPENANNKIHTQIWNSTR